MQKKNRTLLISHIILCLFWFVETTFAFQLQELSEEEIAVYMEEWKPLEVTGNAIPWDVFASTTETRECTIDHEGFDYCIIAPGYSESIKSLNGKEVILMGFMFPLEQSEKQKNFLIGPYPLSCPFHFHIGPSQVIEVLAKEPIDFSYEPITIKGILQLSFNEETGVFYYLSNAALEE